MYVPEAADLWHGSHELGRDFWFTLQGVYVPEAADLSHGSHELGHDFRGDIRQQPRSAVGWGVAAHDHFCAPTIIQLHRAETIFRGAALWTRTASPTDVIHDHEWGGLRCCCHADGRLEQCAVGLQHEANSNCRCWVRTPPPKKCTLSAVFFGPSGDVF